MPHILIISHSDLLATALQQILIAQHIQSTCIRNWSDNDPQSRTAPDVLLVEDAALPDAGDFWRAIHHLQQGYPTSKIIILASVCDPSHVWEVIEAGAKGYLYLQDRLVPRIPLIIEDVANGGLYLSPTAQTALASIRYYRNQHLTGYQADVLRLMTKQWTAARIASELGRSTAAIYQVQKVLREIFVAETNGELIQKVTTLQLLDSEGQHSGSA